MALNVRQQAAYQHRLSIIRVSRTIGAGAVPGPETYTAGAANLPCLYQYTPNVDDPVEGAGRVKRMTVFTTDIIHMESNTQISDQDIVKNVTLLADGSQSPDYGTYHRVLGAPRRIPNAGRRQANKLSVMAMSMEHVPAGLPY